MTEFELILGVIVIIALILGYLMNKRQEIDRETEYNRHLLAKRRLRIAHKGSDDNDDEEKEDFIASAPKWLKSIAQGANIDLEAIYDGDEEELAKVKAILDKHLPKGGTNGTTANEEVIR